MQGLQNIECMSLGHTSRFHLFIMVAEICCETHFWRSRNTLYVSVKDGHFFLFYIVRQYCLENVLNMHTQLQGIESIMKVVCIVNHQDKFITRLHSCIIFIFLDIRLEACSFTKNESPNKYFSSILSAISPGNCKSRYF